ERRAQQLPHPAARRARRVSICARQERETRSLGRLEVRRHAILGLDEQERRGGETSKRAGDGHRAELATERLVQDRHETWTTVCERALLDKVPRRGTTPSTGDRGRRLGCREGAGEAVGGHEHA